MAGLLVIPRRPLTVGSRVLTADSAAEEIQVPGLAFTADFQVLEFTVCHPAELQVRSNLGSERFQPGTSGFLPAIRLVANRTTLEGRSPPHLAELRGLLITGMAVVTIGRASLTEGATASLTGETITTIAMISSLAALCCRGG